MVVDRWQSFRGIISAIVTPMHADESVNEEALALLVEKQLSRGIEGFYCCGSSGEGPLLNLDERKRILATIVGRVRGKVPVIAHVGTIRTADAVELAKNAEQDGANAVSLVPPYYYKFSKQEIIAYYRRVMSAISIPIIIYNIPQFTGVELDPEMAQALLSEEQVLGVKHTSHNLYSLERMTDKYPDKVFFNGFDEIFLSSLVAGATATVGTTVNIQPELFIALRRYYHQGDMEKARQLQQQINRIIEQMIARGVFQSAKYMAGIGLTDLGPIREPFAVLSAIQKQELDVLYRTVQEYIAHA
ncbi:dihydrodipicolinate synthase family protein [Brenneria corticis]|uniref:Dihydrodipicolinate synthase family protein n=1 Tax=Brenneria corticis TaxID=2173106 RepID=A0A2U1UBJ4_9GAMM|nr:dihydrodipicolinate synthase family protein [Brenneria sp. CFCC 11842]PWC19041.1 dihydrodipicolinate synthase family protein [Brenneria sp. CFCC 11842]